MQHWLKALLRNVSITYDFIFFNSVLNTHVDFVIFINDNKNEGNVTTLLQIKVSNTLR